MDWFCIVFAAIAGFVIGVLFWEVLNSALDKVLKEREDI